MRYLLVVGQCERRLSCILRLNQQQLVPLQLINQTLPRTNTEQRPFNGPSSTTMQVSRYRRRSIPFQ